MSTAATRNVLVLGAGGGLGQALIARFLSDPEVGMVIAVSRSGQTKDLSAPWLSQSRLVWIQSQYDEQSMLEVVGKLAPYAGTFSRVCICHGILHDDHLWPEKRFEDIDASAMLEIFQANTITPSLWLKVLHKTLASKLPCIVAVFSARVGSTSDNRLGGWYSYRASKAALNSLLKSFAVEYARRLKKRQADSLSSRHSGYRFVQAVPGFSTRAESVFRSLCGRSTGRDYGQRRPGWAAVLSRLGWQKYPVLDSG